MNNKFKGDLDFYELEDISHRLEVIELILREDEIPFSMKSTYGAGNSEMWLFEGTAKRNGDNYIAENIIGKKFKGSTGDDDGNDIIFTKVIYDHEFFELEIEGSILCKAQKFNFEGILESVENRIENKHTPDTLLQDTKKFQNPKKRSQNNRRKGLFFIKSEIEDLPINFKSYIQANRTFISEIEEYEKILKGLDFSKNLFEWANECRSHISQFECDIQRFIDNDYHIETFYDEKNFMAQCLEEILDRAPNDISFRIDNLTEEQQNQIAAVDAYFYSVYEKLKKKGYSVYETWIDAV